MRRNRIELSVIVVLLVLAFGLLSASYEGSKDNRFFDIVSKFSFAMLVAIVSRLVNLSFSLTDAQKDTALGRYETFSKLGMMLVHDPLSDFEVRDRLAKSKRIQVLKTWFPENADIEVGLQHALTNNGASVKLLMAHPDSRMLSVRSVGAGESADHGALTVMRLLRHIDGWVSQGKKGKFEICLYDGWPGCPVIWYDRNILMGFYFVGKASSCWPWVEVKHNSKLAKILNEQFELLWKDEGKIDTCQKLRDWLDRHARRTPPGTP